MSSKESPSLRQPQTPPPPSKTPSEAARQSQPTTPQPDTPQPMTPQPMTPQPTTPQPDTPQPTTPQPMTPQPNNNFEELPTTPELIKKAEDLSEDLVQDSICPKTPDISKEATREQVQTPTELVSVKREAEEVSELEKNLTFNEHNRNLSNSENIPPIVEEAVKPDIDNKNVEVETAKKSHGLSKPNEAKAKKVRVPKVKRTDDEVKVQKVRKRPKYISEFLNLQQEVVNEEEVETAKIEPEPMVKIETIEETLESVIVTESEEKDKVWEEHDYTFKMPWVKKTSSIVSSSEEVKVPRELVALFPVAKSISFKKRLEEEERQIAARFLSEGIDFEDVQFLRMAHQELSKTNLQDKSRELAETIEAARQVKWSEHCPTRLYEDEEELTSLNEIGREAEGMMRRQIGCVRTRGFSKISEEEKMNQREPMSMKRSVESSEAEATKSATVHSLNNEDFGNDMSSTTNAARGARSQQRRLMASIDIHEVFKFSQLKVIFLI